MRHGESNQTKRHEQSADQKETAGDGEIGNQQAGHRAEKTGKYPDSTSSDWDPRCVSRHRASRLSPRVREVVPGGAELEQIQ